jgi:glycosyltransferase involved in cell wall biosynthesis
MNRRQKMTRVSIITPSYNIEGEQFVRSRESIDNQTNNDFEWIIVDDGSGANPYYRSITLENNYGPSVARNVGFQISSGDIITYLDMGDELYPDRVENLIKLYDQYDIEICFSGYDIVQGEIRQRFDHFNHIGKTHSAYDYIKLLKNQNISIPMGVSHKRKPFVEVGGFQRGIVCGEDGVLWRRMVDKILPAKVMFTDAIVGTYYISQHGQSRTQRRFEMGGFAIDGELMDNGRYLDNDWYETFNSKGRYD